MQQQQRHTVCWKLPRACGQSCRINNGQQIFYTFLIFLHIFGYYFANAQYSSNANRQPNFWDYADMSHHNAGPPSFHPQHTGGLFQFAPQQQQQPFGLFSTLQQQQQMPMFNAVNNNNWMHKLNANGHYMQSPPVSPPRLHSASTFPSAHHQLPFASYRGSAFAAPYGSSNSGVDLAQRERLAQIADESESFGRGGIWKGEQQAQRGGGSELQRILATVAEKLPKIAETMANIGNGKRQTITSPPIQPQKEKFVVEEFEGEDDGRANGGNKGGILLARREYEIDSNARREEEDNGAGKLIDSMPQPASLFSFNKLLAAFSGAGAEKPLDRIQNGAARFQLKSAPILKSEDIEPELIVQQKSTKDELVSHNNQRQKTHEQSFQPHLTPPPDPPPPMAQNPFGSLLQQFGIPNLLSRAATAAANSAKVKSEQELERERRQKQTTQQEEDGNSGDLFGNLMKGKLPQMPDWLRQFGLDNMLGMTTKGQQATAGGAEEQQPGNALAQLFGRGGGGAGKGGGFGLSSVLGSGLDDAPPR